MPHYADGTEAKVGDQVIGKLYNTDGIKAGVIVSITPGQESCNAMVQFADVKLAEGAKESLRMSIYVEPSKPLIRVVKGEQHGSSGANYVVYFCSDYCATNELTKIS
jgi:hypothetical protein